MDQQDHYWCDFCGRYEADMVCPVLGPVQTMQDSAVQPRARASLPKGLAIQNTAEGQEGVFAKVPLSGRMQFGPLEAPRVEATQQDNIPFPLKVFNSCGSFQYLDTTDDEHCNWMKFVRPATNASEHNLVAYQQGPDVFFLTQKDIPVGGELRVWYAANYAKKMERHLLTSRDEASPPVTHASEHRTAGEQPTSNHNTETIVGNTGQQEAIRGGMNTSSGQPKSFQPDVQQVRKMTHKKHQEDVEKSKADPLSGLQAGEGRGQGHMIKDICRKKTSSIPKATEVVNNKANENSPAQLLCAGCVERFEDREVLKKHIEKEHPDKVEPVRKRPRRVSVKFHFCQVCEDRFPKNSELLFHLSTCHVAGQKPERQWQDDRDIDSGGESEEYQTDAEPAVSVKKRKRNRQAKGKAVTKRKNQIEHSEQIWCSHCDVTFNSPSACNRHGRTVHGLVTGTERLVQVKDATLHCQYCSAPFCSFKNLRLHLLSIHDSGKKAYKCDTCQGSFALPKDLQDHLKQAGTKCKLQCQHCDQRFSSLADARVHEQQQHAVTNAASHTYSHTNNAYGPMEAPKAKTDVFWCCYCDQVFVQSSGFYKHRRNFHGLETCGVSTDKAVCTLCQAPFTSERLLRSHVCKIHGLDTPGDVGVGQKTSVCETCSEEFSGPAEHETHLKCMEGKCLVSCCGCRERFTSLPSLRFHELSSHQAVECPQCQARCANQSALGRHVRNHHSASNTQDNSDPGQRWCKYCDVSFNVTDALKKHMTKYHGIGLDSGASPIDVEHCSLCNAPFTRRRSLFSHLQEVHQVFPDSALQVNSTVISPVYACGTCCRKFHGPEQLQCHLEQRMGQCTVSCKQCGVCFDNLPCLRLHEYHKHSVVKCKLCQETFVNANSLGKHMKKVHLNSEQGDPKSPKWCHYCDMNFASNKSLTKHMKVYHGEGLITLDSACASTDLQRCSVCDAPFTSVRSVQKHVQDIHQIYADSQTLVSPSVSKTYECQTCLKILSGPQQLQAHLTDRDGQCSMKCEECEEMFDSLPLLRLHQDKVHLSVKCKLCSAEFTHGSALGKHMKKVHCSDCEEDTRSFSQRWCPYCDKILADTGSFNKHMKGCHYPPRQSFSKDPSCATAPLQHCRICEAPYTSQQLLIKHTREVHRLPAVTGNKETTEGRPEVHQCETCCQRFLNPKYLDDHLRSGLGKCRMTCSQCKEIFTRLSHLRVHQAEVCGRRCKEAERKQDEPLSGSSTLLDTESVILATLKQQWCSHCDLILAGQSALSQHMAEWHEKGSAPGVVLLYCRACNSPFTCETKLLLHVEKQHKVTHTSTLDLADHVPAPVQCGSCQKDFSSVQELEEHLLMRNQACCMDCNNCGLQFYSILRLRWHHYRTHTGGEKGLQPEKDKFFCDLCTSFFNTDEQLSNHLSGHAGQDVYQCPVCGQGQPDNTILSHVLAHSEVRQDLRCTHCDNTFDQTGALMKHLQTHQLSQHICPTCKSVFSDLDELRSHLQERQCDTEQKLRCPKCTEVCLSVYNLCTHIKQCKTAVAKNFLSCELCKVSFSHLSALRNHQALQHSCPGEWLDCPHCEYRTKDGKGQLWRHFREHDLLTDLCDDESTSVTCNLCGTAIAKKGLRRHMKKHEKVKYIFKCKFCPGEFFSHSQLQQHIANHIYRNGMMCPLCDCPLKKSGLLCKHLKNVHQQALYQCPVCQKEIIYQKSFEAHLATHKGDIVLERRLGMRTSECDICGKRFAGTVLVKRHKEQVHMNVRKFKCDVCSKDFKRKAELVVHKSVHSDNYPHLCMYCGKCFKVRASLDQHITIHLNIKKYACHVCGKAFNQKVNMKKHLETHNNGKEFQCDSCGKTFQHSDTLRMHMRLTHLGEGKFPCQFCGKKFLLESVRKVHEDGVHRGIRNKTCQACGQVMTYTHTLKRHFRRKHPNLFDKYFPTSRTGNQSCSEKTFGGSLNSSAMEGMSVRQGRKRRQKDHYTSITQEPPPNQHLTMSTVGISTSQECEKEMLSTVGEGTNGGEHTLGHVEASGDSHTTFIIIADQGQTVPSSTQVVDSPTTVTTTDSWVSRQVQGDTVASCEIILSAEEYMEGQ